MLKSIAISNYALIDQVTIEFGAGFSVITGETGAGKSILLGALGLILGQRADSSVLMNKDDKCVVEGVFDISGYHLQEWMEQNELDFDSLTVIRREILPNGKSRAFVNDTPTNLLVLKDFTSLLIDIHSQHQTLLLGENHFQMKVVDTVSGTAATLKDYSFYYNQYKELQKKQAQLLNNHQQQKNDEEYWRFQFQKLNEAKLVAGEQETLEQRLQQLTHAEEIKVNLLQSINLLDGDETSVVDSLRQAKVCLEKIANYIETGSDYVNRIQSAYIDLKDLANELQIKETNIEFSSAEIETVSARLSLLFELQQKHQVKTVGELIEMKQSLNEKLIHVENFEFELEAINKELKAARIVLIEKAAKLTAMRQASFAGIESHLVKDLQALGMPHASFKVALANKADFGFDGCDEISFLFSANKSGQLAPIHKVASGGEMSRLMLCIKSLISSSFDLPTLILDEIDTGVSGEIAHQMGLIMDRMAVSCQVISITHLPQIAGRGKTHYKVYKIDSDNITTSKIEILDDEQRVVEIAKMLSGSELSDAAMKNARELLNH